MALNKAESPDGPEGGDNNTPDRLCSWCTHERSLHIYAGASCAICDCTHFAYSGFTKASAPGATFAGITSTDTDDDTDDNSGTGHETVLRYLRGILGENVRIGYITGKQLREDPDAIQRMLEDAVANCTDPTHNHDINGINDINNRLGDAIGDATGRIHGPGYGNRDDSSDSDPATDGAADGVDSYVASLSIAKALWSFYTACKQVGFNEEQAMSLVETMIMRNSS